MNSSKTISSLTYKSLPTYKSPPVVVIPPAEARVVRPVTFKSFGMKTVGVELVPKFIA